MAVDTKGARLDHLPVRPVQRRPVADDGAPVEDGPPIRPAARMPVVAGPLRTPASRASHTADQHRREPLRLCGVAEGPARSGRTRRRRTKRSEGRRRCRYDASAGSWLSGPSPWPSTCPASSLRPGRSGALPLLRPSLPIRRRRRVPRRSIWRSGPTRRLSPPRRRADRPSGSLLLPRSALPARYRRSRAFCLASLVFLTALEQSPPRPPSSHVFVTHVSQPQPQVVGHLRGQAGGGDFRQRIFERAADGASSFHQVGP